MASNDYALVLSFANVSSRAYDVLRRFIYSLLHCELCEIILMQGSNLDRLLGCVLSMSAVDFLILEALDNSVFLCLVQDTQRIYELELLTITSH